MSAMASAALAAVRAAGGDVVLTDGRLRLVASSPLPAEVVEQVRKLLLGIDASAEGKAILAGMETARFLPAADVDYDVVRRYVARFEKEVRPVEKR